MMQDYPLWQPSMGNATRACGVQQQFKFALTKILATVCYTL